MSSSESNRIPKQQGEIVDRSVTIAFNFDGRRCQDSKLFL